MRILLIHSFQIQNVNPVFNAVSYYRMNKPNEVLQRLYPEFEFTHAHTEEILPDEYLKEFNLVIFCRQIHNDKEIIDQLNKLDIPFGLDLDDYWYLCEDHILQEHYDLNDITNKIIESIKVAHFVTCTTEILANKIKEHNKNVYVIENGIDTDDQVWQNNHIESKRIRYGFTQGSTHIPDVYSIHQDIQQSLYNQDFYNNCQITLTGWSGVKKEQSIYVAYERMLTDNLNTLSVERDYVNKLKDYRTPNGISKPYRRIESLPVYEFAKVYDEIDISVSPLLHNEFNNCKSELKMIEAGFKGCAIICHNVNPYSNLMTKDNSFDLTEKSFYEWSKYILNNPSIVKDKANQLTLDVQRFSLDLLTDKRKELYEQYK